MLFEKKYCVTQLKLNTVDKLRSTIFCCLYVCQALVSPNQISTFSIYAGIKAPYWVTHSILGLVILFVFSWIIFCVWKLRSSGEERMRDYAEKSGHVPSNWRHVLQLNLSVQVFRILDPMSSFVPSNKIGNSVSQLYYWCSQVQVCHLPKLRPLSPLWSSPAPPRPRYGTTSF